MGPKHMTTSTPGLVTSFFFLAQRCHSDRIFSGSASSAMSSARCGKLSTASTTSGWPAWRGTVHSVRSTRNLLRLSSKLQEAVLSSLFPSARYISHLHYIPHQIQQISIVLKASIMVLVHLSAARGSMSATLWHFPPCLPNAVSRPEYLHSCNTLKIL